MKHRRMIYKVVLFASLAIGLTLTPAMLAQQQRNAGQQHRENVLEVPPASETSRQVRPPDCPTCQYYELTGSSVAHMSPALQAFFTTTHLTQVPYGQSCLNKEFGDSFNIKCCKVCRAELELGVRQTGDLPWNDDIALGQAPFGLNGGGGLMIIGQRIWTQIPPDPLAKTLTLSLTSAEVNALNALISKADGCNVPIDVYVEDDTEVDYVRLKIWTF